MQSQAEGISCLIVTAKPIAMIGSTPFANVHAPMKSPPHGTPSTGPLDDGSGRGLVRASTFPHYFFERIASSNGM